jgi:hypothetical protein
VISLEQTQSQDIFRDVLVVNDWIDFRLSIEAGAYTSLVPRHTREGKGINEAEVYGNKWKASASGDD